MEWEDYNSSNESLLNSYQRYIPTSIRCPKCGLYIKFDNSVVLTSIPPQFRYVCDCGWSDTSYKRWYGI